MELVSRGNIDDQGSARTAETPSGSQKIQPDRFQRKRTLTHGECRAAQQSSILAEHPGLRHL